MDCRELRSRKPDALGTFAEHAGTKRPAACKLKATLMSRSLSEQVGNREHKRVTSLSRLVLRVVNVEPR